MHSVSMGHLEIIPLFLISLISWVATCNAHTFLDFFTAASQQLHSMGTGPTGQPFPECISKHPEGVPGRIYAPDSSAYLDYLTAASQNPRWFNLTAQRPSFIVTPGRPEEIRPVILCGKELGLQVRVKSGGHDYEGLSFRSQAGPFVMVDLSNLIATTVDVKEETAWIEAGVTLGRLYYEIYKQSSTLAFPGGLYRGVGSGGHISGGGLGTLLRKYGLAADNVVDARIMDVNGAILDRKSMGEDLFWAIRGGGGASFGVILAWKLKLVQVPEQVTGFTIRRRFSPENFDLLQKWQNNAYKLPEDLFIRVLIFPDRSKGEETFLRINYNGLFLGTAEELVLLLKNTFPEFEMETRHCTGEKITCTERPCPRLSCYQVPWIRSVLFFMSMNPPTDYAPEVLLEHQNATTSFQKATSDFLQAPIPNEGFMMLHDMLTPMMEEYFPMVIMDPFGGKMDAIAENETPFPYRKGTLYSLQYLANWGDNAEEEKQVNWLREVHRKMEPYMPRSPRPAYLNYKDLGLGQNDQNCSYEQAKVWGEKYFKGNFERLARVKGRVDPGNFFKNEQSIPVLL